MALAAAGQLQMKKENNSVNSVSRTTIGSGACRDEAMGEGGWSIKSKTKNLKDVPKVFKSLCSSVWVCGY